ncbi:hypothetical protein MRY87_02545 [bacterium]|nr:hypothetical protein [bacterium]
MELVGLVKYVLAFLGAYAIADLSTRYILRRCLERELVDHPNDRKLHTTAVPRLGGVAVFIAFHTISLLLVTSIGELFAPERLSPLWWFQFVIPSSVLLLVGVVDDLFELSPLVKLAGQITAVSLLFSSGTSIDQIAIFELGPVADYVITLFWFLLVINAFNLIDGLDGLASGLAIIAAFGLFGIFLISNEIFSALILLTFAGATLGFLRHNFHPAKIFLGDSGSMFLGFSLAAFTLHSPSKSSTVATLGACVLALGVPLLDTGLAVWRRSVRKLFSTGDGVMTADMEHLHHRLVNRGLHQRRVALLLYALSAFFMVAGLLSLLYSSYAHGIYLLAFTFGTYVILRHLAHVELWDSGTAIARGISRPGSAVIASFLYPFADVFVMSLALVISARLVIPFQSWGEFRNLFLVLSPIWVGLSFVALGVAGSYERVWSRARSSEFVYLIAAFACGAAVSAGVTEFLGETFVSFDLAVFGTLYFGIGGGLLTAVRALPRISLDLLALHSGSRGGKEITRKRLLVIGADTLFLRYLKERDLNESELFPIQVVGIIDEDTNLRKRIVHGYRVIGTTQELSNLLPELQVDEIVVTAGAFRKSPRGGRDEYHLLRQLAEQYTLSLKEWKISEDSLLPARETLRDEIEQERLTPQRSQETSVPSTKAGEISSSLLS